VAIYEYQCEQHERFELHQPMGTATDSALCPQCGAPARRMMSAPRIVTRGHGAWTAAIDRADKSRYEPEVVTRLPSTGMRRSTPVVPLTPTLRGLPRP
jgi:putative FmdB family regulatory protein